jgi:hypothetical protein
MFGVWRNSGNRGGLPLGPHRFSEMASFGWEMQALAEGRTNETGMLEWEDRMRLYRNDIISQKYANKFWEEQNSGECPNVALLILDAVNEATMRGCETPLTDAQLVEPWITDSEHRAVSYTDYECLADFCRSLERRLKALDLEQQNNANS